MFPLKSATTKLSELDDETTDLS